MSHHQPDDDCNIAVKTAGISVLRCLISLSVCVYVSICYLSIEYRCSSKIWHKHINCICLVVEITSVQLAQSRIIRRLDQWK